MDSFVIYVGLNKIILQIYYFRKLCEGRKRTQKIIEK